MSDSFSHRLSELNNLIQSCNANKMIYTNQMDTAMFINPIDSETEDTKTNTTSYRLGKKYKNFFDIVEKIGGKLTYVCSGASGHTFKGTIRENGKEKNYAVKVVAFPKKDTYGCDINDIKRPENAELLMIRTLSYFVVKKHTPHIILPYLTFNSSIQPFVSLIEDGKISSRQHKYAEFVEKYKNDDFRNEVSILISEWANGGDLLDFLRKKFQEKKHKNEYILPVMFWKVIFFQILSVLAVIQHKFKSFRHNDLKANNILLEKIESTGRSELSQYVVVKKIYRVPKIGFRIKLWDFDFACIPGQVDNAKVEHKWTDKINVKPVQNRYYDIHFFFNTLINKSFASWIMNDRYTDPEVAEFINRVVPPKLRSEKYLVEKGKGRIRIDKEYVLPKSLLENDPFFEEFRNTKIIGRQKTEVDYKEDSESLSPTAIIASIKKKNYK